MPKLVVRLLVPAAAAVLLVACSGGSSGTGSPSTSASSPTTSGNPPTAEQTAWAGQVCGATAQLKTSIQGLATAATAGGGDAKTRITAQLQVVKTSANTLVDTVAAVPKGSENDPDLAPVQGSSQQLKASLDTLQQSVTTLVDAEGGAVLTALAAVGKAASASLDALSATAEAIGTATKDQKGTLGQAFAANSTCTALEQQ